MTLNQIKMQLKSRDYRFLRDNPALGNNIILLTLGGSHAYGTNTETSDLDIRGCTLHSKKEILTGKYAEQYTNIETDTTIYTFNKLISLLTNVNPNTIEMLGCKPEHYLHLSPIGKALIDNRHMFLSKKCIQSFGGYANAQLRRLDNKAARLVDQSAQERHILRSIDNASVTFKEKYAVYPDDGLRLYVDMSDREDMESEIYMDVSLQHYPLRDYTAMHAEMSAIVKDYSKLGKRNQHAIEHGKLGKHMMHLIRLYLMCIDILESGEILTYREKEHDLLMDIRNGKYLDDQSQPTAEFMDMVAEYESKLETLKQTTDLPETPNLKHIEQFTASVNELVVTGRINCFNEDL